MTVMDVTHPYFLDQDKQGITKLLSSETPVFECEKKFICKDGSEIWALITVVKFWDEERGEEVMLAMAQNIQDRVLAMQELYRAKERAVLSERLKSSFMQNMSHEFRTPMNGIMGFSQLLMQGVQDQNDVKEFGQYINRSGKRMLQLIDNILDFAKIDSGQEAVQKEAFNVDHMLNKILDLYRSTAFSKGLELNYVIPDNLKNTMVHTDEQKLLQILAKLMDNAIDFTSKGKVEITADIKEGSLILNVKDTGCGISKANLSIIFDSFYQADMSYTRAHEGVGLGLPICRGLARLLDGDITLVSEPGIGSEFSIVVPVSLVEQD